MESNKIQVTFNVEKGTADRKVMCLYRNQIHVFTASGLIVSRDMTYVKSMLQDDKS